MKDRDLRTIVCILAKRVNYLQDEIEKLKDPHISNCKCGLCTGYKSDPFITGLAGRYGVPKVELNKILNGED